MNFKRWDIVLSHIKFLMVGKTKTRFLTLNFCFRASILVNKGNIAELILFKSNIRIYMSQCEHSLHMNQEWVHIWILCFNEATSFVKVMHTMFLETFPLTEHRPVNKMYSSCICYILTFSFLKKKEKKIIIENLNSGKFAQCNILLCA